MMLYPERTDRGTRASARREMPRRGVAPRTFAPWASPALLLIGLLACVFVASASAQDRPRTDEESGGDNASAASSAMVVCVSPSAGEVGIDALRRGGNAVDSAVATALALAVTYPQAGNIGGGGFMMILPGPGRQPVCVDYRERAPGRATLDMFEIGETALSRKAVGVPGTVRGLALAHRRFGRLEWKSLVRPAERLAREGFEIDRQLADSLNGVLRGRFSRRFEELQRVFAPPREEGWRQGDRMVQPDLAETLRRIADDGPDAFYTGEIARQIVAEMRRSPPGLITLEDLADYRAELRAPIHCRFRGCDVYGPPPPSSGGVCLALMLNTVSHFGLAEKGRWTPETSHLLIETMKRAFLDRARYLGDSDFVSIPAHLTTKAYAARLAEQIDRRRATDSESLAPEIPIIDEGPDTTHFSIVDADGMAVSNTYTLEQSYGSRFVVQGAGFLLNNEMGDFNWKPGHTDRRGRIGTDANVIAPGKRMLSSQTPVLVTRNGRVFLVTGSPGGRTIINTAFQVVLNVLEFDMNPRDAVDAPRLHHQWLPDEARCEPAFMKAHPELVAELRRRGHRLSDSAESQGDAHSILADPRTGRLTGAADRRINEQARVFALP